MNDWIAIYQTDLLYKAEQIKVLLEENGIEAVVMNQKDSSFKLGPITVMINETDANKAAEIIKSEYRE